MKNTVKTFTGAALKVAVGSINNKAEQLRKGEKEAVVKVAEGNHKTGTIPTFNLPPIVTCGGNCAVCSRHCYALKDYLSGKDENLSFKFNTVAGSHCRNMVALQDNPEKAKADLMAYFDKLTAPRFFRVHASGDFALTINGDPLAYARMWYEIAEKHPGTCFLAFTKCYDIAREIPFDTLPNFELVLSEWTDELEAPADLKERYRTSRAVNELADARANEMICPGNCDTCGACWNLSKVGHDVAFEIH